MSKEYDRYRCHICGHSIWHHITVRNSSGAEQNTHTGGTKVWKNRRI